MKLHVGRTRLLKLELKKFFYGSFAFAIATTFIMFVLVLTSDFLARHGLIHILLTLAGFILTICAIWAGITAINKCGTAKKAEDIIVLFFSSLHALFTGFILFLLIT